MSEDAINAALAALARDFLNIETLEERRSDSLDFHDIGVVGLRKALRAAFDAGKSADPSSICRPGA